MRPAELVAFGDREHLKIGSVQKPAPETGEVLIRVPAAGVNPVDVGNREDGPWAGLEVPTVPGADFWGVIEERGKRVRNLASRMRQRVGEFSGHLVVIRL